MIDIILYVIGLACLFYFTTILGYAGNTASMLYMWLMLGIGFIGLGALVSLNRKLDFFRFIPKWILVIVALVLAVGVFLFSILYGCVMSKMTAKPGDDCKYVVVLGAQIKGTRVSRSLKYRLDGAIEYYQKNNDTTIVVSGGQGPDEVTTEAEVMKNYLLENGIPMENIIVEDRSTTTKENLLYSKELILQDCGQESLQGVAICSNNFHIFRAMQLAKNLGYEKPEGLATKSDSILLYNYMIRDSLAIFKEVLLGNIKLF